MNVKPFCIVLVDEHGIVKVKALIELFVTTLGTKAISTSPAVLYWSYPSTLRQFYRSMQLIKRVEILHSALPTPGRSPIAHEVHPMMKVQARLPKCLIF